MKFSNWIFSSVVLTLILNCSSHQSIPSESVEKKVDSPLTAKGRTWENKDTITLIGPGSSVEFLFKGSQLELNIQSIKTANNFNYFSVEIDGKDLGRTQILKEESKWITFELPDNSQNHTVKIFKSTEAANGLIQINAIKGGEIIQTKNIKKKKIEFIGNSITCGMGNDEGILKCGKGEWYDQHNAYLAYGPTVSRALDIDFLLSSVSGYGMYRNWNSEEFQEKSLPEVYENLFLNLDKEAPFGNDFQPDVVSIALGTNDMSLGDKKKPRSPFEKEKFIQAYKDFIQLIYNRYPKTKVVLLNSPMLGEKENQLLLECLNEIKNYFKTDKEHGKIEVFEFKLLQPTGCDYHPSREEHADMAKQIEPFYRKALGL